MAPYIDDATPEEGIEVSIIDIRSDQASIELKNDIKAGLEVSEGQQKSLPTMLLYDEAGLKWFEKITYLDEYYLTGEELELLEQNATDIAANVPDGGMIVELGSGNLRKIKLLLQALESAEKRVQYYALDLDRTELVRTLSQVAPLRWQHVNCSGLHGTYDDGLRWLNLPEQASKPKFVLWMGSSLGNFSRPEAGDFLKGFISALQPSDQMLIGIDACEDEQRVLSAYNDSQGVTTQFTLNGLKHANSLLGSDIFKLEDWNHVGKYRDNMHEAFVAPKRDLEILGISICKGELIKIEQSCKYSRAQIQHLWRRAGAVETARWSNDQADYGLHLIKRAINMNALTPEKYAAHPVPSLAEWETLWQSWDVVTRQMIPDEELQSKPIKLRNACIFYLGHIPTFLDMKIVQATGCLATEPSYFHNIFERGIDPDVDNPEHCHVHSEIPDEWPPLDEILQYQKNVRARVKHMYDSGLAYEDLWTGRVLWLGLEHEAMHLETLLYMLLQSDKTVPPLGIPHPDFVAQAKAADADSKPLEWVDVPAQTVKLGLNDPDNRAGPLRHFGWDVEKPERVAKVDALRTASRPITNLEYARYLVHEHENKIPASWSETSAQTTSNISLESFIANKTVKTVFGPVPLSLALYWPATASYDELAKCAAYMGGRIPTEEEARSIYDYAHILKQLECSGSVQKTIPAVNGHLSNEGVQETPPEAQPVKDSNGRAIPIPSATFADLSSANVGFKHWTPVPVTGSANKLAGQAEMGGVWEWTSSSLEKQEGFEPMELYPAYSADFYDGKHNIVLGGSWATHPRLAGRKSFVNWYQRNYPYVWAGARLVKDAV